MLRTSALVLTCAALAGAQDPEKANVDVVVIEDAGWTIPPDLMLRARVAAIQPPAPSDIHWRHGGEGLGGSPVKGVLGQTLAVGAWSPAVPVASLDKRFPARLFLTVTAGNGGRLVRDGEKHGYHATEGHSTGVELEFEVAWKGKVLKTFREKGPDGGTVGLVVPAYRLAGGKTPEDPAFVDELEGLLAYARRRTRVLEQTPWAKGPWPRRIAVVTNLDGYGTGRYHGTRFTDPAIVEAECGALRLLGVNGLTHPPKFVRDRIPDRSSYAAPFGRIMYAQLGGYPVPRHEPGKSSPPDAGCPFSPAIEGRTRTMIEAGLAAARAMPTEEVWWRTEDEIGTVVDRAPEGKGHLAACPRCAEGFRAYLQGLGLKPGDVGRAAWEDVAPLDIWKKEPLNLPDPGAARTAFYTAHFNNYASAKLFTPLRQALAEANKAGGKPVYSFALRGNTFLMGGHSLDFFDFYRHADNAFVYETSNRDARIWSWDSYLCDVGRVMSAEQSLKFGVYVKPHRGAPVQRALSAVARGADMLYWYTYGPDYAKGDTFAGQPDVLLLVSRAASLLGKTEEVLHGACWAVPPEVGVVNPRTSEIWARLSGGTAAAWENAKWTYTALQHAHVPVDPLDEVMLARGDLSRYKVLYISGSHLTREAAARVADWVKAGGTLYTSGGGLARDEADRPLEPLAPALGLRARRPVEFWRSVKPYGATALQPFDEPKAVLGTPPAGATVTGAAPFPTAPLAPVVGRERLDPAEGTEVLARFADGAAAVTRRTWGQGRAYVVGFFPGLEYSAAVRREEFDMARDFDPAVRAFVAAPALERVRPVVDASAPLVEGVLVRNATSGRQAVVLMNWAYRVAAKRVSGRSTSTVKRLVPARDVVVRLRGAGDLRRAASAALGRDLALEKDGDGWKIALPALDEGDVLLLD